MEQRLFIEELVKKGLPPKKIRKKLDKKFGESALKDSAMYKWIRMVKLNFRVDEKQYRPGRPIDEQLLFRIQAEHQKNQFSSVRSIAHTLNAPIATVYHYMTDYLGLVFRYTRWVPHILSDDQKVKRIRLCQELYQVIIKSKKNSYRDLITGDESWFLYNYAPKGAWTIDSETHPLFESQLICSEKMMITIVWGVWGIYIIDELPENTTMDSNYFINNILIPLYEQKNNIWPNSGRRKIWLHIDNASVHNSNMTKEKIQNTCFKRAPHPPFSPDVAPSDFFLFGYVKEKLRGQRFKSRFELYEAINEIVQSIPHEMKVKVFDEWANRCKWVFEHNGSYFISD